MKKIWIAPYELLTNHAVRGKLARKGTLLRVEFKDGTVGFADCHPWQENGDAPLDEQLAAMRCKQWTPLLERSLYFAALDAHARSQKKSLFDGYVIPRSHAFYSNLSACQTNDISTNLAEGITHIKVKMGENLEEEIPQLIALCRTHSQAKFRIDFNGKLDYQTFRKTLENLRTIASSIDFYEDPIPFDSTTWAALHRENVPLACDYQSLDAISHPLPAKVLVVKPAVQDPELFSKALTSGRHLVVTTYLDHPLGQLGAAYIAALWHSRYPDQIEVCGLLSHTAYRRNEFSEQLQHRDGVLIPPQGSGFGFDLLLETQNWQLLI